MFGRCSIPICSGEMESISSALLVLLRAQYTRDCAQITGNQHDRKAKHCGEEGVFLFF